MCTRVMPMTIGPPSRVCPISSRPFVASGWSYWEIW
jgi:hypothetical protein